MGAWVRGWACRGSVWRRGEERERERERGEEREELGGGGGEGEERGGESGEVM